VTLSFSDTKKKPVSATVVPASGWKAVKKSLDAKSCAWAEANGFEGGLGQICKLPDESGEIGQVLFGFGSEETRARGRFHLANLAKGLVDRKKLEAIANAAALAQDLINTPASDMGPDALEAAFRAFVGPDLGLERRAQSDACRQRRLF